jgi:hypothetical protein
LKKLITMTICFVMAIEVLTGSSVYAEKLSIPQSSSYISENSLDSIAAAEIDNVNASIDSNKKVTVSGEITSGAGQQITIRITDSKGNLEYANNTISTAGGNFTFSYTMANKLFGKYDVSIGGKGVSSPATASFNYGIDADLSNLSISSGTFNKDFAAGITSYTASVDNSVTSITVTPTLRDTKAAVSVNNTGVLSGQASVPINLIVGSNTINVVVTAQDGITSKTYTITVTREKVVITATASIDNNKKVTVSGAITSGAGQQVTAKITDPKGNLEYVNNTISTTGGNFTFSYIMTNKLFGKYDVSLGGAGISTPATASFNYGIDADLSNLSINSGTFGQTFDPEITYYSANVDNSVSSITVTPTLSDTKASVSVNSISVLSGQASAAINLNEGSNTINVVVTAQDGITTKTYTITVIRNKVGVTSVTAVNASIDSNKKVTVTGIISSKNRQLVTVRITDPKGNLEYINNTISPMTGNFTFSYTMTNTLKGRYDVAIGGTGIASPATAYFYYGPDADLNNLSISSGAFDQAFAIDTTSYSASVDYSVYSVAVTPTLSDTKAAVSINSISVSSGHASAPINLNYGSNTINIVVKAQDGITTKAYTIIVYRAAPPAPSSPYTPPPPQLSSDATLSSLLINDGAISINFVPETTSYNASVASGTDNITVTPTVNESHATVMVNGATVVSGAPDRLGIGDLLGKIDVVVTAQDGTKKTYTIAISIGLPSPHSSSDATLSGLLINGGDIPINFAPETTTYNATVASGTYTITVKPTVNEEHATVTVNGADVVNGAIYPLDIGGLVDGEIHVVVTAPDGTKKTYTITISIESSPSHLSSDATLIGLVIDGGDISLYSDPEYKNSTAFDPGITSYYASVDNSVPSVTVTPTLSDTNAAVPVKGISVSSGQPSAPINLNEGSNTIDVVVTTQGGSTTQTYTIIIVKMTAQ